MRNLSWNKKLYNQRGNYKSNNNDFSIPLNIINQRRKDIERYKYETMKDKENINKMLNNIKIEIGEISKNIKETDNKVGFYVNKHFNFEKDKFNKEQRNPYQYQPYNQNNNLKKNINNESYKYNTFSKDINPEKSHFKTESNLNNQNFTNNNNNNTIKYHNQNLSNLNENIKQEKPNKNYNIISKKIYEYYTRKK